VNSGESLEVRWKNDLPSSHVLPVEMKHDPGMGMDPSLPQVRTTIHLHGAAVPESRSHDRFHNNDGWPDDWIVPGETQIATYPNAQSARMLWYHDHAMGVTARNVVAGLAGVYIIRDAFEKRLNLPKDDYEIPLFFETKDFTDEGTLTYPSVMSAEVYGSTAPVNGKICPFLRVEPRKYRFRMVNAASARSFAFKLLDVTDQSDGPPLVQIGTDGGFLENPVILNEPGNPQSQRLLLSPAERADVVVDFSRSAGKIFLLHNNSTASAGEGQLYLPNIMLFKVDLPLKSPDHTVIPKKMKRITRARDIKQIAHRRIVLNQVLTQNLPPVMTLNDQVWGDPISDKIHLGATEVWEILNPLTDTHPFHLHLVQFQILSREKFDVDEFQRTQEIRFDGAPEVPSRSELGWKDTVTLYPGTITRIISRFGPYPGKFVYHCHILEHEDMGMMRPFEVVE
jgi:spore coat protein A